MMVSLTLAGMAAALAGEENENKAGAGPATPADPSINTPDSLEATEWAAVTFFKAPKPLAKDAITEDWPRFLGPRDNCISKETSILKKWPEGGPVKVWEMAKGTGYTAPVISGDRLYYFHRIDNKETLVCLHPETGRRYWSFDYPVVYEDLYGYNNGPRASPVLDAGRVYIAGVTAMLHCLDAKTGDVIWKKDLSAKYNVPQYFFGYGPAPLVLDGRLIVNAGGRSKTPDVPGAKGTCVAAFDKATGEELWTVQDEWGASYASPVAGALHGKKVALVFAGGKSEPAHGGLLCIDPLSGKVHDRFPWRADMRFSVNASTPIFLKGNRVYISETYEKGGVMLEYDKELKSRVVWKAPEFGLHWNTPVLHEGFLYAFPGRNEPDASLACFDAATGESQWSKVMTWKFKAPGPGGRVYELTGGYFRGSLLRIDGRFLCLGELGTLATMELTPKGVVETQRVDLFRARETWSLPVVCRGLLYVSQHGRAITGKQPTRLICYDFRESREKAKP